MGNDAEERFVMAHAFESFEDGSGPYVAELTTGERLFLVRAVADVLELLGEDETIFIPTDGTADPEALGLNRRFDFSSFEVEDLLKPRLEWEHDAEDDVPVEQLEAVLDALSEQDDALAPTDPAVRRLLPDASLDPDVANEFRKYTDFDLREQKVQRLMLLSERLTDVQPSVEDDEHLEFIVDTHEAEAIAGALGDLRLVLGERLDLRNDTDSEDLYEQVVSIATRMQDEHLAAYELSAQDEHRYIMGMLFELAGYLQESLTQCMLIKLRTSRPEL